MTMPTRSIRWKALAAAAFAGVAAAASARAEFPTEWTEILAPRARMSPAAAERWGYHATSWQPWNAADLDGNGGVARPSPQRGWDAPPPMGGPPPAPWPYPPPGRPMPHASAAPGPFTAPAIASPASIGGRTIDASTRWSSNGATAPAPLTDAAPQFRPNRPLTVSRNSLESDATSGSRIEAPPLAAGEPRAPLHRATAGLAATSPDGPLLRAVLPPSTLPARTPDEIPFAVSAPPSDGAGDSGPRMETPRNIASAQVQPYRRSADAMRDDPIGLTDEAPPAQRALPALAAASVAPPSSPARPAWLAIEPAITDPSASDEILQAADRAPETPIATGRPAPRPQFGEVFRGSRRAEPMTKPPARPKPRASGTADDPLVWPPRSEAADRPFYLP